MEREKPNQHQPEHEDIVCNGAATYVVAEGIQGGNMQREAAAAAAAAGVNGADRPDLADVTAGDEALAHALHMEELMRIEGWGQPGGFEEAPAPSVPLAPAGHAAHPHQFVPRPRDFRGPTAGQVNVNINQAAATAGGALQRYNIRPFNHHQFAPGPRNFGPGPAASQLHTNVHQVAAPMGGAMPVQHYNIHPFNHHQLAPGPRSFGGLAAGQVHTNVNQVVAPVGGAMPVQRYNIHPFNHHQLTPGPRDFGVLTAGQVHANVNQIAALVGAAMPVQRYNIHPFNHHQHAPGPRDFRGLAAGQVDANVNQVAARVGGAMPVQRYNVQPFHHLAPGPRDLGGPAAGHVNANLQQVAAPSGGAVPVQHYNIQPFNLYGDPHPDFGGSAAAADGTGFFAAAAAAQANANNLQPSSSAQANAASNQRGALAHGAVRPLIPQLQDRGAHNFSFLNTSTGGPRAYHNVEPAHRGQPVGGGGATTVRSETRYPPKKDALISAREAVLASGNPRGIFAGMEEEQCDNDWYESILLEAQMMEQMEEPGLHEVPFQSQLPSGSEEPAEEEADDEADSYDPDAPGPSTKRRRPRVAPLADDEVSKFECGICMETLPVLDLFHGMQCEHRFCVECMAAYIEGRVRDGEVPIPCPDPACMKEAAVAEDQEGVGLHPEVCKKSIDFAAFSSWGDRLTERAIHPSRRAFCPNSRCGVMLEAAGGTAPAMAFCPACGHPMCATCGFDWSDEDGGGRHDCAEGPNAAYVRKLAAERRWKQCPRCKMLVERISGCAVMRCRCLFIFCYTCGLATGRQAGMEEGPELCQCMTHPLLHGEWLNDG